MDADHSPSPDSAPPQGASPDAAPLDRAQPAAELEARLQTAVEAFLDELRGGARPDRAKIVAAAPDLAPWLDERLRLVELVFHAGQAAESADDADGPPTAGLPPRDRARRLKCPHCGNRVQLVEPRPKEVTCVNCGSSFRVEANTTATYHSSGPAGTIGRFQILELLGRGAFGEVYKARDGELDRFVALKFPRADYFADSEDARRFLREARSAAGLRHPGIVQVHEIAHAGGSPYIVSDFIDGLTLADLISGGRPACRESAELVAQLADALDYAHRQKVIHRDIKPSNILLATTREKAIGGGSQFVPYLTDFGLARRDEAEMAVTLDGQVLGTPAYMSPEQAAGDHARVDGRSDVYSLGVVLYELLSGELPFRGSRRMLLHQVLNDEPRPPRTLNERIPRDLETICLKAMAKEPARRYATSADFRDDLRRYLCGDAIHARRVGRLERVWRWSRRNPTIAGLAASLALALIGGTTVASYFAMAQRAARIDADTLKGEAIVAREHSERVAARSLIVPLDASALVGEVLSRDEVLSRPEREVLWELATLKDDAVWLRCIDEATRDPKLTTALFARSEPAVIAAVGLNLDRRDRAAALLLERVRDTSLSVGQRAEVAFFALELAEEPSSLAASCVASIHEAMAFEEYSKRPEISAWRRSHHLFWRAKSNLEPTSLAALMVGGPPSADSLGNVTADTLVTVANRLDSVEAERTLSVGIKRAASPRSVWSLSRGLAGVAERSDRSGAAGVRRAAARAMLRAISENRPPYDITWMEYHELVDLASRMEPAEGAAILAEALCAVANDYDNLFARGLISVAARMDGAEGSRVCTDAAHVLVDRMRRHDSDNDLERFSKALAAIAEIMQPTDCVQVCGDAATVLSEALRRRKDLSDELVKGLAEIAARMPPDDAARICGPAAKLLTESLAVETDSHQLALRAAGCASLAGHLAEPDARRVCDELVTTLTKLGERKWKFGKGYDEGNDLQVVVAAVAEIAARMKASEAQRVCELAAQALVPLRRQEFEAQDPWKSADSYAREMALVKLAPLMSSAEATRLLTAALRRQADGDRPIHLVAPALIAVAARMEPEQHARVRAEVIDLLTERSRKTKNEYELPDLARGLADVVTEIEPNDAAVAVSTVSDALVKRLRAGGAEDILVKALLVVATRLEPKRRAGICADAARVIIEKHRSEGWVDDWISGGTGRDPVSLLAEQMDRREGAQLVGLAMRAHLADRIARMLRYGGWGSVDEYALVESLSHCDNRMAASAAALLAQHICFDGDPLFDSQNRPYAATRFNDLLSEVPPKSAYVDDLVPRGCRLTTPQLVELLKMPTCFGAARRVILDHLERRYDRRFNTVWAFVRFAEAERLGLDFTTPPVRPDPANLKFPPP